MNKFYSQGVVHDHGEEITQEDMDNLEFKQECFKEQAIAALLKLRNEKRLEVFELFCTHCGCVQPTGSYSKCQCWNDE